MVMELDTAHSLEISIHETAKQYVPAPVLHSMKGATVGIIAYGSTEAAVLEARHQLETEHGIKTEFLRIRALPFTKEVDAFLAKYDQVFVVEMNRDGQMHQILLTEYAQYAPNLKSVAFGDGHHRRGRIDPDAAPKAGHRAFADARGQIRGRGLITL